MATRETKAGHTLPSIIGRSSSHFTRVVRVFAAELGVEYTLQVVPDLMALDSAAYAGNPALKIPVLRTPRGVWFGALNICRELARASDRELRVVWPEELDDVLLANFQELVLQAMATEVTLIMAKVSGLEDTSGIVTKPRGSLLSSLSWLEQHAERALGALPAERDVSFLEVSLYCLMTHLEFRQIAPTDCYPKLGEFCRNFGMRRSAQDTPYRFDVPT